MFWFKLPIQYFNWTACLALCNLGTGTFTKGSEGMKKWHPYSEAGIREGSITPTPTPATPQNLEPHY